MADLDPQLQSSIDNLQTRHTALVDAVRNYSGGSVAESTSDLIAAKNDVMTAVDTRESALLGLIQRDTTKPVPSLLSDFKTQTYMLGTRRLDHGVSVDDMWNIQRASSKWVMGPQGKLVEIPENEPAYHYDPSTGEALGVLIEESRTNLAKYSEDFTNGAWASQNNWTRDGQASPTPSGVYQRFVAQADDTNSLLQNIAGGDGRITMSVFVGDATTMGALLFSVNDTAGDSHRQSVKLPELTAGADNASGNPTVRHEDVSGGNRISVTFDNFNVSTVRAGVVLRNSESSTSFSSDLNDGDVAEMDGFQIEEGAPTSYIPTTDTPVTRAADEVSRVLGDEFNRTQGTFYVEYQRDYATTDAFTHAVFEIVSDLPGSPIFALERADDSTRNRSGKTPYSTNTISSPYTLGSVSKVAVTFLSDGTMINAVDGVASPNPADSSGAYPVYQNATKINLNRRRGVTYRGGFRYYPYAMTETELQELTQ